MYSEFLRIQHSIDSICNFRQVAASFKWIRIFESHFCDTAGVHELTQTLINQLKDIEI